MAATDSPPIQAGVLPVTDDLGAALREARKSSGLPFSRFARLAGFSESHLRNIENGHRPPNLPVVQAYDRVLVTGGRFAVAFALTCAVPGPDGDLGVPWDQGGTLSAMTGLLNGGGVVCWRVH